MMTPLNIAHIRVSSEVRGLERNTIRMMNYEKKRGHNTWIISSNGSPVTMLARKAGMDAVTGPISGDANPLTPCWVAITLRSHHADILHLHGSHGAFLSSLGGRLAGIPVVATLHNSYSYFAYSKADHLMAVSSAVRDHMLAQGVRPDKVSVVRNGIDLQTFIPRSREDARAELGLANDRCYFATANVLSTVKGMPDLLATFLRLHERFPNTELLIAGDGPLRGELEQIVDAQGMRGYVRFFGFLDDVRPIIAAADCLVLNSRSREGLPQVLMQAMAMGRPVVATDVGGSAEVVSKPEVGLLIPPKDNDRLLHALTYVCENPAWREDAGQGGRAHVEQHFNVETQINGIEAVYRRFVR